MEPCFFPGDFLLPDPQKTDIRHFGVVACDQFTSSPSYWEEVEKFVGDRPSALRLFLPEIYLSETEARLPLIRENMKRALEETLLSYPDSVIYVERSQSNGKIRHGIVGVVDLDAYDPKTGSISPIRASEGLVLERIPPRAAVRRGAPLEMTHILLLIDDPEKTVIEPLKDTKDKTLLYEDDLMQNGGHIKGEKLGAAAQENLLRAIGKLAEEKTAQAEKENKAPILFMVGDGNHSLATAKAVYEEAKAKEGDAVSKSPLRYASVEVVNLADDAIEFEPIYRVLFGVDPEKVIADFAAYANVQNGCRAPQTVECLFAGGKTPVKVPSPVKDLTVATLQDFLDKYLSEHKEIRIDYVHGLSDVEELAKKPNTLCFVFDSIEKSALFPAVMRDGVLPRKTFSMGEATDKRYYIEVRKI